MRNILIIIFSVILLSCMEKEISFNGEDKETLIAVSAFFTPGQNFSVELSPTMPVVGKEIVIKPIDNATVVVQGSGIEETLVYNNGKYVGKNRPKEGMSYKIIVNHPNYENIETNVFIPNSVAFSISSIQGYMDNSGDGNYSLFDKKIKVSIPGSSKDTYNFYRIILKVVGYDEEGSIAKIKYLEIASKDPVLTGKVISSIGDDYNNKFGVFSDELFDGKSHDIEILFYSSDLYYDNDFNILRKELVVEIQSISEDYYKFLKSYAQQLDGDDSPFTEPIQLWSNVKGGVGIGAGFSVSEQNIVIPNKSTYDEN